jgi:hypothetical protein
MVPKWLPKMGTNGGSNNLPCSPETMEPLRLFVERDGVEEAAHAILEASTDTGSQRKRASVPSPHE